jgi:hypothetical protein
MGSNKDEAEGVFEEGQKLYGEQRFSEAAERWGRAALLQHAPSHVHVSDMLIDGRPGVAAGVEASLPVYVGWCGAGLRAHQGRARPLLSRRLWRCCRPSERACAVKGERCGG